MIDLNCDLEMRRRDVRQASERAEGILYGLSYVEAELTSPNNFRTARLTVYFLGRSPEGLSQANVRLEGGPFGAPCRPGLRSAGYSRINRFSPGRPR